MKANLKKGIVFFVAGLMIMQAFLTGGSKKASADHSENATLKCFHYLNTDMKKKDWNVNLPEPFNIPHNWLTALGIKDPVNGGNYQPSYCIGYGKPADTKDNLSSKEEDTNNMMSQEQAMLINYAIMFGYNEQNVDATKMKANEAEYFATQLLVWIIKEGCFYDDVKRTQVEEHFFKAFPIIKSEYEKIYNKLIEQIKVPSFANEEENIMKWNEQTNRFELTLVNGNNNALNNAKVNTSSLPEGVTATLNGNNLVFTSTNEITQVFEVEITKNISEKGRVIVWKNAGENKQEQVTIDKDLEAIAQTFVIKLKTEQKPVVQETITEPTPAPAPTEKPGEEEVEGEVEGEELYEEKEIEEVITKEEAEQEYDAAPKTADNSNLRLLYTVLGASAITMFGLVIVSMVEKKKQGYKID